MEHGEKCKIFYVPPTNWLGFFNQLVILSEVQFSSKHHHQEKFRCECLKPGLHSYWETHQRHRRQRCVFTSSTALIR